VIQTLLNVPKTVGEWATFSFSHAQVHREIRQALLSQRGFATGDYVLDPIPTERNEVDEWLGRVQQTHNEMNDALGLQSNSLVGVDFSDAGQAAAWIYLNWQEDNAAMVALKL
jgi:hypothetical protein